jgi:hypothetical protein
MENTPYVANQNLEQEKSAIMHNLESGRAHYLTIPIPGGDIDVALNQIKGIEDFVIPKFKEVQVWRWMSKDSTCFYVKIMLKELLSTYPVSLGRGMGQRNEMCDSE